MGHAGPVTAVALHPLKYALLSASTDQSVRLWDLTAAEIVHKVLSNEVDDRPPGDCTCAYRQPGAVRAFSAQAVGDRAWQLFVALEEGQCLVWLVHDLRAPRLLGGARHKGNAQALLIDQEFLVSAGEDCKLRFWHAGLYHSLGSWDVKYGRVWSMGMQGMELAVGCNEGLLVGDLVLDAVTLDAPMAKRRLFKATRRQNLTVRSERAS